MKKYFFKISAKYSTKNSLQKSVKDYVLELDGTLLNGDKALYKFKNRINNAVVGFNRANSRCRPVEVVFFKHDDIDFVSLESGFHAAIYPVNHEK